MFGRITKMQRFERKVRVRARCKGYIDVGRGSEKEKSDMGVMLN